MGPDVIIALLGLGGAGVTALWRIANGMGKLEARTSEILKNLVRMVDDHEERLRSLEHRD